MHDHQLHDALRILYPDVDITETRHQQFAVMVEAFEKFMERDEVYGGLWAAGGADDSAFHIKSKAFRAVALLRQQKDRGDTTRDERLAAQIDTGIDLVNFAIFYVRNVRSGR